MTHLQRLHRELTVIAIAATLLLWPAFLRAETGSRLWLRYTAPANQAQHVAVQRTLTALVMSLDTPTGAVIARELERASLGFLGRAVPRVVRPRADGAVVIGTPASSPLIAELGWTAVLARLGREGYVIRSVTIAGHAATVVASSGDSGALYGTFHFLRLIQTGQPLDRLDVESRPRLARRLLNHWDNLDGSSERGYAGRSLW